MKRLLLPYILPFVQIYWRIFRPNTYGVKILLVHDEHILLVQHSYGNRSSWQIPGGGYNPKKEKAEDAAKREMIEEIGVRAENLTLISEYYSESEGKRDTVTIFRMDVRIRPTIQKSAEIHDVTWVSWSEALQKRKITQITRYAIESAFKEK